MRPPTNDPDSAVLALLLIRCAQGDYDAFRRLYDLQAKTLYSAALGIVRTPSVAADVAQEAWIQVWRNADRFDPQRGTPRVWLLSIVRNRAFDALNKIGRPGPNPDPGDILDTEMDPHEILEASEAGRALRICLRRLDSARRRLVVLAYGYGITQVELASRVERPLGTVKSTLRRALGELRACLGQKP